MLSRLGYAGLRALGVPEILRQVRSGALILAYHNVVRERHTPAGDPGLHLSADRFHEQLQALRRHFHAIPLAELVDRIRRHLPLRGLVALTFDDGYRGAFEVGVPILRDLGMPATFFLVGEPPEAEQSFWWDHPAVVRDDAESHRTLRLHELRGDQTAIVAALGPSGEERVPASYRPLPLDTALATLPEGIEIGAHSQRHRNLTRLSAEELETDLVECRLAIERRVGVRPTLFAYPYGAWDRRVRDAVRAVGYSAAVTLDSHFAAHDSDPWALPRLNIPASLEAPTFDCWIAGIHR